MQWRYWREYESKTQFLSQFVYLHCNLNSILAHNFIKLSLLRAYISINKFHVICFSETYIGSSISSEEENLEVLGNNLVRADNPTKRSDMFICCYNFLPLKVIDIQFLKWICNKCDVKNSEIRLGGKVWTFFVYVCLADNFESNLNIPIDKNSFLIVCCFR